MTAAAYLQWGVVIVMIAIATPLLGRYMAGGVRRGRRSRARRPGLRSRRAGHLPAHRRRREARAAVAVVRLQPARLQLDLGAVPVPAAAHPARAAVQPDATSPNVPDALSFNTAVSFVTNTNWQNYARRVHRQPPHPDGRPRGPELRLRGRRHRGRRSRSIRGLTRRRSATIGNFWVDLTRTITRILLPLSFVFALIFVSQGVIQNLHGFTEVTTARRRDPGDPRRPVRRARKPSRSSAPTAAASSTPTRRTRSRTRTRSPTCSRSSCCS